MKKNIPQSKKAVSAFLFNFSVLNLKLQWAIAFVFWLLVSFIFVIPLWYEPTLAMQNDDYWHISEWFGSNEPYPYSHFGPGYPFLIYLCRSIGFDVFGMVVIQKILVALNGIAIYHLGRTLGLKQNIALVAATAFTIFPIVQINSSVFHTENLYLLLASIAVAIIFRQIQYKNNASMGWLILGYGILGIAALVRVNAYVLLLGCLIIGLFTIPWRKIVIVGAIATIPMLGWSTLNWHWYGHFSSTSSGNAAIATSIIGPVMIEQTGIKHQSQPEIWFETDEVKQYNNLFDLSKDARSEAIDYALKHPIPVIIGNIKGWARSLMGSDKMLFDRLFGEVSSSFWSASCYILRFVLILGLIGFFVTGQYRYQLAFSAFLCVMFVAHVLTAGAAGYSRFGYPVDAFSVLALAFFVQYILLRINSDKSGSTIIKLNPK